MHNVKPLIKTMLPFPPLQAATLMKRENRFRVTIQVGGLITAAHLGNPGRLQELLVPEADIWVSRSKNAARRTAFTLELIRIKNTLVSVNSFIPNKLVDLALQEGNLPGIANYENYRREVRLGNSRMDFCLLHHTSLTWVEVKSVTLVTNGFAAFPDAPTARGRRHLNELIEAVHKGAHSLVLFVVQRDDATAFRPHDETDPEFGMLLRKAVKTGVKVMATSCTVTTKGITLTRYLPIHL